MLVVSERACLGVVFVNEICALYVFNNLLTWTWTYIATLKEEISYDNNKNSHFKF